MTDEEQLRYERDQEMSRREMARKSQDVIRIYNPLDQPFKFQWDGYWNTIAARSFKDVPRYLAMHYFKKISNYMIGLQMMKTGEELLALREKQLGKTFLDKYSENREVWDKTPRLDDPDLLKQIKETVIIGLVEEYGSELQAEPESPVSKLDLRSTHDQLFEENLAHVGKELPQPQKPAVIKPIVKRVSESEVSV